MRPLGASGPGKTEQDKSLLNAKPDACRGREVTHGPAAEGPELGTRWSRGRTVRGRVGVGEERFEFREEGVVPQGAG